MAKRTRFEITPGSVRASLRLIEEHAKTIGQLRASVPTEYADDYDSWEWTEEDDICGAIAAARRLQAEARHLEQRLTSELVRKLDSTVADEFPCPDARPRQFSWKKKTPNS